MKVAPPTGKVASLPCSIMSQGESNSIYLLLPRLNHFNNTISGLRNLEGLGRATKVLLPFSITLLLYRKHLWRNLRKGIGKGRYYYQALSINLFCIGNLFARCTVDFNSSHGCCNKRVWFGVGHIEMGVV